MTVKELIREYYAHDPNGHFFDKDTLDFFGERMSEMKLLKDKAIVTDAHGKDHVCYVITTIQHKHPCGPTRAYHHFDAETFDHILV